jgi:membrane-associated phospholipid phosphatase
MTAFKQLIPRLVAIAALGVTFLGFTLAVAIGWLNGADRTVEQALAGLWRPSLHVLFQAIAELGGLELTSMLMILLVIYLIRRGFPADAWVFVAFVAVQAFEIFYKAQLYHPQPAATAAHDDGPSITELLGPSISGSHNSYPSGHMVRAVLVYGLIAFVIRRLAPWPWARALALPCAVVIIVLLAFDRLYLDVHWESDVLGGILLGAIAMVAATVWLDRPRGAQN